MGSCLRDVVDGGDDVGAGGFEDDDEDGRVTVVHAEGVDILDGVNDGGDIAEADDACGVGGGGSGV